MCDWTILRFAIVAESLPGSVGFEQTETRASDLRQVWVA